MQSNMNLALSFALRWLRVTFVLNALFARQKIRVIIQASAIPKYVFLRPTRIRLHNSK